MRIDHASLRDEAAFSLLEVMIALGIFFMCIFAILDLTSQSIHAARNLLPMTVDATSAAAELSLTNRLEEGPIPPHIGQHFADLYPGYSVDGLITEVGTNGFFQVDFSVYGRGNNKGGDSRLSILLFRPLSTRRVTGPGIIGR